MIKINTTHLVSILYILAFIGPGVSYGKLYLFHVALVPVMILLHFSVTASNRYSLIPSRGWRFYVFFFVWYVLSVFWSINRTYSYVYLGYLFFGGIIIFSALYWMDSFYKQTRVFKALVVVALADIGFSVLEVISRFRLPVSPFSKYLDLVGRGGQGGIVTAYTSSMPTGFHWNPNNLAGVMIIILPFFLFSPKKWVRFAGSLTILLLIIAAGSRGCLLAYIITLIIWGFAYSAKRAFKIFFFYLPIGVFLGVLFLNIPQIANNKKVAEAMSTFSAVKDYIAFNKTSHADYSISTRKYLIVRGIEELKRTYGLGVGAGASRYVFEQESSSITSMHNFWIELLVEGGLLAGGGFIIWYIFIAVQLYKKYFKYKQSITYKENHIARYFCGALSTSMTGYFFAAVSASSVIYVLPMWIMIGFALATINNEKHLVSKRRTIK